MKLNQQVINYQADDITTEHLPISPELHRSRVEVLTCFL